MQTVKINQTNQTEVSVNCPHCDKQKTIYSVCDGVGIQCEGCLEWFKVEVEKYGFEIPEEAPFTIDNVEPRQQVNYQDKPAHLKFKRSSFTDCLDTNIVCGHCFKGKLVGTETVINGGFYLCAMCGKSTCIEIEEEPGTKQPTTSVNPDVVKALEADIVQASKVIEKELKKAVEGFRILSKKIRNIASNLECYKKKKITGPFGDAKSLSDYFQKAFRFNEDIVFDGKVVNVVSTQEYPGSREPSDVNCLITLSDGSEITTREKKTVQIPDGQVKAGPLPDKIEASSLDSISCGTPNLTAGKIEGSTASCYFDLSGYDFNITPPEDAEKQAKANMTLGYLPLYDRPVKPGHYWHFDHEDKEWSMLQWDGKVVWLPGLESEQPLAAWKGSWLGPLKHPKSNMTVEEVCKEWLKGCSCADNKEPQQCQECTDAFLSKIKTMFNNPK